MNIMFFINTWLALLIFFNVNAQTIDNPSFEGEPGDAVVPMGWHWCEEGTTPDIVPGPWGVFTKASEGSTYVGLITRPDGSFESIGQRLSSPLLIDACYKLQLDLAHSATYTGYNAKTTLRIWLGTDKCQKDKLVAEVKGVHHFDWKTYAFEVVTEKAYEYIIIEAYFPIKGFYSSGNILIDNIRQLKPCDGV